MYIQEEFIVTDASMERVEAVMTDRELMLRWMSPAVQFEPLGAWRFEQGDSWKMTLTGLGNLLEAGYVVIERRPGLVLWAYDGFWKGFDAWHWLPNPGNPHQTIIQNRLEYELRIPGLDLVWPFTIAPLMGWDARLQMQRLKGVCEDVSNTVSV